MTAARDRLVRLLHVAKRELRMADDSYRAVIVQASQGRSDSSKDLSELELEAALRHMKRCGFKVHGGKPARPPQDKAALMGKIEAQLADMKLPWAYLTSTKHGKSMVQRLAGVDTLEFATLDGLQKIVAALAYRQKKLGSGGAAPSPQPSPSGGGSTYD